MTPVAPPRPLAERIADDLAAVASTVVARPGPGARLVEAAA